MVVRGMDPVGVWAGCLRGSRRRLTGSAKKHGGATTSSTPTRPSLAAPIDDGRCDTFAFQSSETPRCIPRSRRRCGARERPRHAVVFKTTVLVQRVSHHYDLLGSSDELCTSCVPVLNPGSPTSLIQTDQAGNAGWGPPIPPHQLGDSSERKIELTKLTPIFAQRFGPLVVQSFKVVTRKSELTRGRPGPSRVDELRLTCLG